MNLFIFVICALIAHASSQYYYFEQPSIFPLPQINPSYSTFHGNPNYFRVPGSVSHFQTVPGSIPEPVAPPTERPPSTLTYHGNSNYFRVPGSVSHFHTVPGSIPEPAATPTERSTDNNEYRGFAYQTTTQNGANSHVLFLTGPQAHQINTRVYNNFQRQAFGDDYNNNNNNDNPARTVASDMVDSTLPNNIQDIYNPPMQRVDNTEQFFRSFFQSAPQTRLVNFYSRNTDLFAQPAPGYPADVFPLTDDIISPRFGESSKESNTTDTNRNETEVTAESIRTDTRFRLNDVPETTQTPKENLVTFGEGSLTSEALPSLKSGRTPLVRADESRSSKPSPSSSASVISTSETPTDISPNPGSLNEGLSTIALYRMMLSNSSVPNNWADTSSGVTTDDSVVLSNTTFKESLSGNFNQTSGNLVSQAAYGDDTSMTSSSELDSTTSSMGSGTSSATSELSESSTLSMFSTTPLTSGRLQDAASDDSPSASFPISENSESTEELTDSFSTTSLDGPGFSTDTTSSSFESESISTDDSITSSPEETTPSSLTTLDSIISTTLSSNINHTLNSNQTEIDTSTPTSRILINKEEDTTLSLLADTIDNATIKTDSPTTENAD